MRPTSVPGSKGNDDSSFERDLANLAPDQRSPQPDLRVRNDLPALVERLQVEEPAVRVRMLVPREAVSKPQTGADAELDP